MENHNIQLQFLSSDTSSQLDIPMAGSGVSAGFPSPADPFLEPPLDLNQALIRNPAATFYARVSGESMKDDGIYNGDLLIVDKSIEPYNDCVAVCFLNGEFTLKRVRMEQGHIALIPANPHYHPIEVSPDDEFSIWGVVTYSIHKH